MPSFACYSNFNNKYDSLDGRKKEKPPAFAIALH